MGVEVFLDGVDERFAVLLEFLHAYTADIGKLVFVGRVVAGHFAKGNIGENDVGRDALFGGEFLTQSSEDGEELFIAVDAAGCWWTNPLCSLFGYARASELDRFAFSKGALPFGVSSRTLWFSAF